MMNTNLRREELAAMKVAELKALATEYGFKVSGKKAEIIEEILEFEYDLNDEELQATNEDFEHFESLQKIESIINSIKEMTDEEKMDVILGFNKNITMDYIINQVISDMFWYAIYKHHCLGYGKHYSEECDPFHDAIEVYVKNEMSVSHILSYFISKCIKEQLKHEEHEERRRRNLQKEEKQEESINDSQKDDSCYTWQNLVSEMNMKDGQPHIYEHVADRPLLQQIMLHVCRDLYLDSQRAVKAANGDKTVKQFGPVYVGKKHSGLHMKDAMAKGTVKAAAEKVLPQELRKKYIVLNSETKHTEFKKAVELLKRLENAGLIIGEKTDKDYAKFYTVYPDKILAFLQAVGCLKQSQ